MIDNTPDLLTDVFTQDPKFIRKKLLPLWIKIFSWIFLVIGLLLPLIIFSGIVMHSFAAAMYGLETENIYSFEALLLISIYAFKTFTAYGLLKYKDWAVKFGIIDAITGIAICTGVMGYQIVQDIKFDFRLELLFLIPYLIKLQKIKTNWKN